MAPRNMLCGFRLSRARRSLPVELDVVSRMVAVLPPLLHYQANRLAGHKF